MKQSVSLNSRPEVHASKLWQQHCSWCPRCDATKPGCDLGREAYGLYDWLVRIPIQRAG